MYPKDISRVASKQHRVGVLVCALLHPVDNLVSVVAHLGSHQAPRYGATRRGPGFDLFLLRRGFGLDELLRLASAHLLGLRGGVFSSRKPYRLGASYPSPLRSHRAVHVDEVVLFRLASQGEQPDAFLAG